MNLPIICIDAADRPNSVQPVQPWEPGAAFNLVEGDRYHAIGVFTMLDKAGKVLEGYELAENPGNSLYFTDRFVPVSDIDETESEYYRLNKIVRDAIEENGPVPPIPVHWNCRCVIIANPKTTNWFYNMFTGNGKI